MRNKKLVLISLLLITAGLMLPGLLFPEASIADSWTQVADKGIDGNYKHIEDGIYSSAAFNGNFYVGTGGSSPCEIWEYDGAAWSQFSTSGFGDDLNIQASSMAVYNDGTGDKLYVGTLNQSTGCEIWEYDPGTGWSQVNTDGFGDLYQWGASSMAVYDDGMGEQLYVGTYAYYMYTACNVWRYDGSTWEEVVGQGPPGTPTAAGFGNSNNLSAPSMVSYNDGSWPNDRLYVGTGDFTISSTGCDLWEYDPGSGWSSLTIDGFGDVNNNATSALYTYDPGTGLNLFVGTGNDITGCVLREYDPGVGWTVHTSNGFGDSDNYIASSIGDFDPGTGLNLYVGTGNLHSGCELWEYDPGTGWSQFNTDGFGTLSNTAIFALQSYGANLYAGSGMDDAIMQYRQGCQVWEYDTATGWSQVNDSGFAPDNNLDATSMAVFDSGSGDNLYVGTFDRANGCQVWGYDGASWSQFNTDGFGDDSNLRASSMTVFNDGTGDKLYVGTYNYYDGCEVWEYDPGTGWSQFNTDGFGDTENEDVMSVAAYNDGTGDKLYAGTYNSNTGCEVWEYDPGTGWSQFNTDGFGDSGRSGSSALAAYGSDLYSGTESYSLGCEVFKYIPGVGWSDANLPSGDKYVGCMETYGSNLYVGTGKEVPTTGGLWSYDGSSWVEITAAGFSGEVTAMCTYGPDLYVGTTWYSWGNDVEVWSYDGSSMTQECTQNFGDEDNRGISSLSAYSGSIYVGTWNESGGCQIWEGALDGSISSINPTSANQGDILDVTITGTGTNFDSTSYATFSGAGITVNSTNDSGLTQVTANITIDSGASTGERDVNVVTQGATQQEVPDPLVGGFTVNTHTPAPTISSINPTSGLVGTEVTINGTNFGTTQGSSYVKFNTTKATSYTSWSDTQVKCKVPSGATTGQVKVTTADGTSNAKTFTVTQPTPPKPEVEDVVPSSGPPGTEVTVTGSNFGSTQGSGENGGAASYVAFGGVQATEYASWSDTKIVCTVPQGATPGAVTVVTSSGTSNTDKTFTVATPTWYLAEGTTDWGFDCYISIENPNEEQVGARVTYMTKDGPQEKPEITLPAGSQTTINPRDDLGNIDFSTKVECTTEGKTIAVDRTMSWTGPGAPSPDGHCSVGVTSPEKTWYLPEGSSDWGFECWLLIQNPNDTEATATVTYMIEGKGPQPFEKKVPANSRASFNMADDIGAEDASIKVESNKPVIPERAMYRNNRREGHDSIGTTTPATDYYLAEGTTDWGFTTYVLVQNPNDTPADVTVTYMTGEGPVPQGSFTMEPNSRKTIRVNDVLPNEDLSTKVSGSQPIIAERAMYWDNGTGEACHDSIGMDSPHTTFYLPDGETSNGRETWTLVANPNDTEVTVEVTYLTPDGQGNPTFTDTVPANSRKTYNMADAGIQGRAAIMVTSKTPDKKIMVERAMYWNGRGAGTDTIGGYLD